MKVLLISFFALSQLIAFGQARKCFNNLGIAEDSVYTSNTYLTLIDSLNERILKIDEFIKTNEDKVILMAQTSPSEELKEVIEGQWPENVLESVNIIKNEHGQVIYYASYPTSESGDWFIGYQYYVDNVTGKVYGFKRMANFFNSECTEGVIKELSTYLFDSESKLISKQYSLQDNEGNNLIGKLCFFPYDYEYRIAKSINELIEINAAQH